MCRDFGREIDELRKKLDELTEFIKGDNTPQALFENKPVFSSNVSFITSRQPQKNCETDNQTNGAVSTGAISNGTVSYSGFYSLHGKNCVWEANQVSAESLLGLDDEKVANILNALGNKQRLSILKEILTKPLTVNEIIETSNLGTTGQAYHHLKILQSADFITTGQGKKYEFRSEHVQGLMMILAGIHQLFAARYKNEHI